MMDSIAEHRVDTTEDIDISALLDPSVYFSELVNLRTLVLRICEWQESSASDANSVSVASMNIDGWSLTAKDLPMLELDQHKFEHRLYEGYPYGSPDEKSRHDNFRKRPNLHLDIDERNCHKKARSDASVDERNAYGMLRQFTVDSDTADVKSIQSLTGIMCELESTVAALRVMKDEGFCGRTISVLVDTSGRSDIIESVDLAIADVEYLLAGIKDKLSCGTPTRLLDVTARLLAKFGVVRSSHHSDGTSAPASVEDIITKMDDDTGLFPDAVLRHLDLLSALLSLSVRSYVGSHCVSNDIQPFGPSVTTVRFDRICTGTVIQNNLRLRQRRLACLDDYLGSNVWTFGTSESSSPRASILCSVEQLTDLWGPTFAVPSRPGQFTELLSLNLEGGILHRVTSTEAIVIEARSQSSSRHIAERIYHMHFTPTGPVRRCRHKDATESGMLFVHVRDEHHVPSEFSPFPSSARLLIGRPDASTYEPVGDDSEGMTALEAVTKSRGLQSGNNVDPPQVIAIASQRESKSRVLSASSLTEIQILGVDSRCSSCLSDFGQTHALDLHALGTAKARYLPEAYQVNFGGGQWVNAGIQKSWKLRPASTYKAMLVEMCSKPRMKQHIHKILERRVGLEWSTCTSNAERRNLWAVLKRAFPADAAALDAAYASQDNQTIAEYVADLSSTGLDEQNRLRVFWPLSGGLPQILEVATRLPKWIKILRDTQETACFAVASDRCLVHELNPHESGNDDAGPKKGPRATVLATTINVHNAAQGPLRTGQHLRLNSGHLEICKRPAMVLNGHTGHRAQTGPGLAAFSDNYYGSIWRSGLRSRLVDGGYTPPTSRELLHEDDASKQTVQLCIVDKGAIP